MLCLREYYIKYKELQRFCYSRNFANAGKFLPCGHFLPTRVGRESSHERIFYLLNPGERA